MADDLRLRVVLDMADKALGPIKSITKGSAELARQVQATQDQLKKLGNQQKLISAFNDTRKAMGDAGNKLRVLQSQLDSMRQSGTATARAMAQQEKAVAKQTAAYDKQKASVLALRQRLNGLGVANVSAAQAGMAAAVATANKQLDAQTAKLAKLNSLKAQHGKQMAHMGMVAAGGVGAMAAGRQVARPVGAVMGAYSQQEDARTALSGAMMQADGSLPEEFKKLNELAISLGNRLPGTTADFYDMLTMLRRQGMSAQTILGGTGEAAAYLGVQLRMPVTEAAEFAAKMQDATQSTEAEMMGLMDTIQRTFYMGVDHNNMLQGFTKLSPVLSILKKKGLDAANVLAPMMVMFDQAGMKGEASGNAVRKVMQGAMDTGKVNKANKGLAPGQRLNFTDGKGEFGGIDKMFSELEKLKGLTTEKRLATMKAIFGDDAETLQVITVLMEKGKSGYEDVIAKMKAQADLQKRVNQQLATLTNVKEAAAGAFTNVMADAGATIQEDLKDLIKWLDGVTDRVRKFIAENPQLVRWLLLATLAVAAVSTGLGAFAVAFASVFGPMLVVRFFLARMGLSAFGAARGVFSLGKVLGGWLLTALRGAASAIAWLARLIGPWLMTALRVAGNAFMWVGRALFMLGRAGLAFIATPIGAALAVLAVGAYLIWKNWDKVQPVLQATWTWIKNTFTGAMAFFGSLGTTFWNYGANLIDGLINGIKSKIGEVKNVVAGMAESVKLWFTTPVEIRSPSRVFMQYGGFISEGAALGIAAKAPMVKNAALAMAALPGLAAAPSFAAPASLDSPGGYSAPAGGGSYAITINAAPGQDPQAIARAVSAELDRRERERGSRQRSTLGDT